jgi:[ribosomal protein S5]-alanine N-acetyltransferase
MINESRINYTLRRWQVGDEPALVKYANNDQISKNLNDDFPNPYSWKDAENWINLCETEARPTNFAIEINYEAVGGVGLLLGRGVHRRTAEIGYWLGEPFWGQGIMTEVVREMSSYAFRNFDIHRLVATAFEYNYASMKVLEKAGFVFEAVLKQNSTKSNKLWDDHIYVKFNNT